jgi:hypothetical protein
LRFAVHRLGDPEASPRSHHMPCGDVLGRIHVGIAGVSARSAPEVGLALARPRVHVPARRAALARERRIDLLDTTGGFLLQPTDEQPPSRGENRLVEPGFLRDIPARHGDTPPRRTSHIFNVQVFNTDCVEAASEMGADFLDPVLSPISFRRPQSADSKFHTSAAVRVAPGARQLPLKAPESSLLGVAGPRHGQHLARGKRRAHSHATVHADSLAIAWHRHLGRNRTEGDMPSSRTIQCNPVRFRGFRYSTRPSETHPANLGYQHRANLSAESAHMRRLQGDHPESLITADLAPAGPAVCAGEKISYCLREVPQGLLLDHLTARPQPAEDRAGLGELSALLQIPWCVTPPALPPGMLLDSEVPYEPSVCAMLPKDRFLRGCRHETIARHSSIKSTGADILGEVERRLLRDLNAGFDTPRCA